ncbi:formate dehydrogenase accessory sulfurtransferase FdhD [Bacillus sp. FJAT-49736]|uniref:formate dehydrogenase accessory sulfurtransferase FdhD n=1 Tax=Bacillus sp. FJAT-49736 TaxID=2833582 RepID=UPI001BC99375|nr:formate dehydrogenase accessory sulfurtransferase FdhD [Bacillus sp. FJAT-49736]MBS4173764.1 formate dehydrogenase accessory sulfurtransferase FdhD [Bacillus sp. FJAT-49736]
MNSSIRNKIQVVKYDGNTLVELEDEVAVEYPLTIYVDGEEFATMVCSPINLEELVIGFLASEGLVRLYDDIESMTFDEGKGLAYISLKVKQSINKEFYAKRFIGSCCGKSRQFYFHNDARTARTVLSKTRITVSQCFLLMKLLQEESIDFRQTGGVHNAALCSVEDLLYIQTDIGRHNALDKIYGICLKEKLSRSDKVIAFSGRVSSEVLLKVAKIGIGIILSKSAPSTLAIELANDLGITIVGFIRNNQFNIYSNPERVIEGKSGF